jgi:hypothetical protein
MLGWSPLWESIVESSIWLEPDYVLRVWVYFLARKDRDGFVPYRSPAVMSNTMRISEDKLLDALKRLESPDKSSTTQTCEGRRVVVVDGGWRVVNHDKYRDKIREEYRREYQRKKQAEYRAKMKALTKSNPLPGETAYVKAAASGASQEQLDNLVDRGNGKGLELDPEFGG